MTGSWERLGLHLMNQPFFLPMTEQASDDETASQQSLGAATRRWVHCNDCRMGFWLITCGCARHFALMTNHFGDMNSTPSFYAPEILYAQCDVCTGKSDVTSTDAIPCPSCGGTNFVR